MYKYRFEKLIVWQLSIENCTSIYELTKQFPDTEKFGLTSQIQRASVSISSNLAEGTGRKTSKDKARFYSIAYSSTLEVINQLIIAKKLDYITEDQYESSRTLLEEISNKIFALKNSEQNRLQDLEENYYLDTSTPQPTTHNPQYFTHETAIIDNGAQIGNNTKIWHFSHIMPTAKIGDNCNLGQNVFVANEVVLGNNVKVQNNVSIYTGVTCEDDVFLGPSMVFTNVINPRSAVNRKEEFQKTHVGKGASIGANATIICGNNIGKHAMIGAGSVVTKDVPEYALVVGNPAKQIGWVCENGCQLNFDEDGKSICEQTGKGYQITNNQVTKLTA